VDLKDIKAVIDLMKKNSVSEFEMEKEGFKIRLKRGGSGVAMVPTEEVAQISYSPQPVGMGGGMAPVAAPAASSGVEIKSPMIGTFYRSPSPESAPYVDIGAEVGPDTVVCIIEAMKVMNEIKAEVKGIVTEILLDSGKPVEFGQPMFKVRPT